MVGSADVSSNLVSILENYQQTNQNLLHYGIITSVEKLRTLRRLGWHGYEQGTMVTVKKIPLKKKPNICQENSRTKREQCSNLWFAAGVPAMLVDVYNFELIGTLRSDNGDVHENVAEKQTSHHLKLFRDYPNSHCYLKEGDFGWCWRKGNALKFGQRW